MNRYYLRITKETTFNGGPKASPTDAEQIWIDYGSESPNVGHKPIPWVHSSVIPGRGVQARLTGAEQYTVMGSFSTRLFHEQARFWKDAVLQPTITGDATDLPSYSVDRVIRTNSLTYIKDRYNGCKFTQASLTGGNQGGMPMINLSASFKGCQRIDGTGLAGFASTPLCEDLPVKLYRWGQHELILGGTDMATWIKQWSISVSHEIGERRNIGAYPNALPWFAWRPTFSGTWDMNATTFYDKYQALLTSLAAAQLSATTLTLDYGGGDTVEAEFTGLVFSDLTNNTPPGGDFTQQGTATPFFACGGTDLEWTITDAV